MINLIKNNLLETAGGLIVLLIALFFTIVSSNSTTERTVWECPSGSKGVIMTNGWYAKPMCDTTVYNHVLTDELNDGVNVRYRDGGKGTIDGIVRVELPSDEVTMLKLHSAFRNEEGIRNKLLRPEIKQALNLTAGMVTSEEAYATKRDNIQEYASDQIENGIYSTEVVDNEDGSTQVKINVDDAGMTIHNSSPFSDYGITVSGFQVTDWKFEAATEQQIQTKRSAEMAEITAKSQAQTAKQEALTVIEQGKKNVAEAMYDQKMKAQIEIQKAERVAAVAVIDAERVKEVNALAEQSATIDVRTATQEALATKKRADGEAYAKKAIIMADGALDKKLAALVEMNKDAMKAYSNRKVPSTILNMSGGGKNGSLDTQTTAFMATQMTKNLNALSLDLKTK